MPITFIMSQPQGGHHVEKTSFVSTNAISEREGGGPGHWFGMLNAELAFSNLPGALFGGTRVFAPKS